MKCDKNQTDLLIDFELPRSLLLNILELLKKFIIGFNIYQLYFLHKLNYL